MATERLLHFGSATAEGVLHAVVFGGNVHGHAAACDASLLVGWTREFKERDAGRMCQRPACKAAKAKCRAIQRAAQNKEPTNA